MKLKWLWIYPAIMAAATAFVLVVSWPWHPHSELGWIVLVTLSVPLCILTVILEEWSLPDPVADRIERVTKDKPISSFRISYYIFKSIVGIALATGILVLILKLVKHLGAL
jgi:hypothetical protein